MVRKIVLSLAVAVAATTFVMLYGGLFDLAVLIGMHAWQAALFPISIDGLTLAALVATLDRRVVGPHLVYAWAVVVIGTAISTFAQFLLHAADEIPGTPWWTAPAIASFPALGLAMVWHLLWILAKDEIEVFELKEEVERVEAPLRSVPEPKVVEPHKPVDVPLEDAVAIVEAAQATGLKLTGTTMAERLGLVDKEGKPHYQRGYYYLKRAEQALSEQTVAA